MRALSLILRRYYAPRAMRTSPLTVPTGIKVEKPMSVEKSPKKEASKETQVERVKKEQAPNNSWGKNDDKNETSGPSYKKDSYNVKSDKSWEKSYQTTDKKLSSWNESKPSSWKESKTSSWKESKPSQQRFKTDGKYLDEQRYTKGPREDRFNKQFRENESKQPATYRTDGYQNQNEKADRYKKSPERYNDNARAPWQGRKEAGSWKDSDSLKHEYRKSEPVRKDGKWGDSEHRKSEPGRKGTEKWGDSEYRKSAPGQKDAEKWGNSEFRKSEQSRKDAGKWGNSEYRKSDPIQSQQKEQKKYVIPKIQNPLTIPVSKLKPSPLASQVVFEPSKSDLVVITRAESSEAKDRLLAKAKESLFKRHDLQIKEYSENKPYSYDRTTSEGNPTHGPGWVDQPLPGDDKVELATFEELGVDKVLVERLAQRMNIKQPTAIQVETLPFMIAGRDVLIQSQTGSGKTLGLLIGLLTMHRPPLPGQVKQRSRLTRKVFVVPSETLAHQLLFWCETLLGKEETKQRVQLRTRPDTVTTVNVLVNPPKEDAPDLVIGTANALVHDLQTHRLDLTHVRLLVMDEGDAVLQPLSNKATYKEQLVRARHPKAASQLMALMEAQRKVVKNQLDTPGSPTITPVQVVLASATLTRQARQELAALHQLSRPILISMGSPVEGPETVEHTYIIARDLDKEGNPAAEPMPAGIKAYERRALAEENAWKKFPMIIEALMKHSKKEKSVLVVLPSRCSKVHLCESLTRRGLNAQILSLMSSGTLFSATSSVSLLIASESDIRGLDLPLSLVIQFGCADSAADYLHVSGRVGRFGQWGQVMTILPDDKHLISRHLLHARWASGGRGAVPWFLALQGQEMKVLDLVKTEKSEKSENSAVTEKEKPENSLVTEKEKPVAIEAIESVPPSA